MNPRRRHIQVFDVLCLGAYVGLGLFFGCCARIVRAFRVVEL